jgi:hypothetical protein
MGCSPHLWGPCVISRIRGGTGGGNAGRRWENARPVEVSGGHAAGKALSDDAFLLPSASSARRLLGFAVAAA